MSPKIKAFLTGPKVLPTLLLLIIGIGACCSGVLKRPGVIETQPLLPLVIKVVQRHDAYLETLEMPGEAEMLLESARLLSGFQMPEVSPEWLEVTLEPVATRHDTWVSEDPLLPDYKKNTALRSTVVLREFYPEAK